MEETNCGPAVPTGFWGVPQRWGQRRCRGTEFPGGSVSWSRRRQCGSSGCGVGFWWGFLLIGGCGRRWKSPQSPEFRGAAAPARPEDRVLSWGAARTQSRGAGWGGPPATPDGRLESCEGAELSPGGGGRGALRKRGRGAYRNGLGGPRRVKGAVAVFIPSPR